MAKLVGKHAENEITRFFYEKANPALFDFFEYVKDSHYKLSDQEKVLSHEKNKLDVNDIYNARFRGVEVTANEWLFYYYVYAMSTPEPPWDQFTVLIKSDGKYRIINDLEACSRDALFEDLKRSFLESKAEREG